MHNIFCKNNRNYGFTLLENLLTIFIVSILSIIVVPHWLFFIEIQRLNVAQDEIYRAMRQAQSEAMKQKLSWQVSFREQNNFIQWTVHQAQAGQFIPSAVSTNDKLWHNLDTNIRIDQEKNQQGKHETTLRKLSSQKAWRVVFNYQGCPIYEVGDECLHTSLKSLGQITLYSQNGAKAKRCVYISTLLGVMRMGKDHIKANENGKYCY
jgi:prepilin-type N-terminal cleavage/methylation domain-containing protein